MTGDDYFVKEISLLYTEFKKMEGHVVQAPNSYLNTLFILNMRRSGGLAEAVPLTVKFGTTLDQIDELRRRLLEFVKEEKREYQGNILTEIRDVVEAHSVNLNVVFFYKSNWQNEGLRLQRRNKFICALMVSMQEIGIEGPLMRLPGQKSEIPFYVQYPVSQAGEPRSPTEPGPDSRSVPLARDQLSAPEAAIQPDPRRQRSILRIPQATRGPRARGESVSSMAKRVDFSLGMKDIASGDIMGDLYEDSPRTRVPGILLASPSRRYENSIAEEDGSTLGLSSAHDERGGRSRFALNRSSTASRSRTKDDLGTVHRNRFSSRENREKESDMGYESLMERGMASIPESSGRGLTMDPRSGTVGAQAVEFDSHSTTDSGAGRSYSAEFDPWPVRESFEMRTID